MVVHRVLITRLGGTRQVRNHPEELLNLAGPPQTVTWNSIPNNRDWAYWDPSGSGTDPPGSRCYTAGFQTPHETKGTGYANISLATITTQPGWLADDGPPAVPKTDHNNAHIKSAIVASGSEGQSLGAGLNGTYQLLADIPTGVSKLTIFGADYGHTGVNANSWLKFDDVELTTPDVPYIAGVRERMSFAWELDINNTSGTTQQLDFTWEGTWVIVAAAVLQRSYTELVWDNTATTDKWEEATNWLPDTAPDADARATIANGDTVLLDQTGE